MSGASRSLASLESSGSPSRFVIPYNGNSVQNVGNGCVVSASGDAWFVNVASGSATIDGLTVTVAAQTAEAQPPGTDGLDRLDLVVVDASGEAYVLSGTASTYPTYPSVPWNAVPLAGLFIQSTTIGLPLTVLTSDHILDKRPIR